MCEIFNYNCPICNYHAHSIEKQQIGLLHGMELAPMLCADCNEVSGSVILGEHFQGAYKELKMHGYNV
jgi:hypothetical protein